MESKVVPDKSFAEVESGESSTEEAESPRSVVNDMKNKLERVHSQILRIRKEDSHIGEDFLDVDLEKKKNYVLYGGGYVHEGRPRPVDVVVVSRRILPCSPLSGRNNVKRPCTEAA